MHISFFRYKGCGIFLDIPSESAHFPWYILYGSTHLFLETSIAIADFLHFLLDMYTVKQYTIPSCYSKWHSKCQLSYIAWQCTFPFWYTVYDNAHFFINTPFASAHSSQKACGSAHFLLDTPYSRAHFSFISYIVWEVHMTVHISFLIYILLCRYAPLQSPPFGRYSNDSLLIG